jgi:transcriptional regulator with XRE-family HTH domain
MNIGERIRQLRGGKSQKELAKLSGMDDTTISKIEGGQLTGTLDIHRKICKALGITLSTLYKGVYEEGIKASENPPPADEKPFRYNEKATSQFLTGNIFLNKKMLPEILILEPGGEALDELPADTQRFLYVLEGKVEIKMQKETYQLKPGSPFYILDASIPHSIKNTGPAKARILRVTDPVRL